MKKILCILLCTCMLIPLAACGGEKQNDAMVVLCERYESVRLTIAKSENGKQAIVEVHEQNERDYFFATDEQGNCYRVKYNSSYSDIIKQGATLYLTYYGEWLTEIENAEEDHGFIPQYDLSGNVWSMKAWQLKDIACEKASEAFEVSAHSLKLIKYTQRESGEYKFYFDVYLAGIEAARVSLGLNADGDIVETDLGYDEEYLKYVGTDIEKEIPNAIQRMNKNAGEEVQHLYFRIKDGYVYLCGESIHHSGNDHSHAMYEEKLGKAQ